jgi:RNA polymerase sigma-70 factor (ECF subfamily)
MPDVMPELHAAPCRCADDSPDRAAFIAWVGELVHRHRWELVAIARREGLSPEDAFDAAQEAFQTFLTLPAARPLVDAGDDSQRLLHTLVRNEARNRRRLHAVARPHDGDAARLAELPADAPSVEDLVAAAELELQLRGCVQELADVQRAVVTLRMLDEASGEDVARRLDLTPGHVAVLLHRAKENLLRCMLRR